MQKALTIVFGSVLIAIGINLFLVPHKLLEGGALGISLIFHYLMDAKVGLTFLLISIPIFIIAWNYYRTFFYNGIHGMLLSSVIIDLLYPLSEIGKYFIINPLISAALGGILIGSGVGIMFRLDISVGGVDLLAQMFARKLKLNPGIVILCFDVVIVSIGCLLITSSHLLLSYTTVLLVGISTSFIISIPKKQKKLQYEKVS
ncbi:YitT family protein [Sporosarcina siberiensis]|uniref:YitT family protein n=1 Tax=Sporosarcina siberiensis TaxID=1365606 RepID=A0ABW4SDZ3_9BACL